MAKYVASKIDLEQLIREEAKNAKSSGNPARYFSEKRYLPQTKQMLTSAMQGMTLSSNSYIARELQRNANVIATDLSKIVNNSKSSVIKQIEEQIQSLVPNGITNYKQWGKGKIAGIQHQTRRSKVVEKETGEKIILPIDPEPALEPTDFEKWYPVNSGWIIMINYAPINATRGILTMILNRKRYYGAYSYPTFPLSLFETMKDLPSNAGTFWWQNYGFKRGFNRVGSYGWKKTEKQFLNQIGKVDIKSPGSKILRKQKGGFKNKLRPGQVPRKGTVTNSKYKSRIIKIKEERNELSIYNNKKTGGRKPRKGR